MLLGRLFSLIAMILMINTSHASDICEPALSSRDSYQAKIVKSTYDQWLAIQSFVRKSIIMGKPNALWNVIIIVSSIEVDQNIAKEKLQKLLHSSHFSFVNLAEITLKNLMHNFWLDVASKKQKKIIVFARPTDFTNELQFTRLFDEKKGRIDFVAVSELGKSFPNRISQLEALFVDPVLNHTLRIYNKAPKLAPTQSIQDDQQKNAKSRGYGTEVTHYALDPKFATDSNDLYEFSVVTGKARGDSNSEGWQVLRRWIKDTPVEKMKEQYQAHPGFSYLLTNLRSYYHYKKIKAPWWSVFTTDELEKLLRARIVSLSIEEMAKIWSPDVYQQFLSAYQIRELKRSQMPPKQMILQYVPPAFAKAFEDLTNARIEKFQSLMFVLENNPEFHQAMNTAKAAWKAHNIHWARAYDPETVALLHYWNVIRLTEDEQIKYLGMTITDNPFSRLAIPVHYETKERWASTLANLESTIESSSIEQLRQTGKLDYASKKLIDQIKYAYPIGGTNGPTWPSFMKTQSWEKLRAANLIKKWPPKPSENE